MYYKKRKNNEDDKIREELVLLAKSHETWGFWMMHHRLRNLGFTWNHKRVYRIYKSMKLNRLISLTNTYKYFKQLIIKLLKNFLLKPQGQFINSQSISEKRY